MSTPFEHLKSKLTGQAITPGQSDYDQARSLFYGGVDLHPRLIARVANIDDVSLVVNTARESGIELAVRGGGHSVVGHSSTEGGIVLDLNQLKVLDVDVAGRTAWAETGLTALEYTTGTIEYGLITGFGDAGSVGIGGITLGGGVGYLVRKHGLTIDSLLGAELVTADGELVLADEESNPDLFWAIRGGGGNFGVATRLRFRLHAIETIVGGMMILPATAETIAGFISESQAAPDDLSTIANVMNCPPMPFVPEELHGTLVIMAMIAWSGPLAEGERVVGKLRSLAEPIADMTGQIPYTDLYQPEDPDYKPQAIGRTLFADHFDEEIAQIVIDQLGNSDASLRVTQLRVLGGALTEVANDATAFAHRDRGLLVNVAAFYDGPEDLPRREEWVSNLTGVLNQGDRSGYVGFLADEGPERVRAAYPGGTWDRLRQVKAKYDPTNLFQRNQNIPPAD